MKLIGIRFICLMAVMLFAAEFAAAAVNIGVQAPRSHTKAIKKWEELANYLATEMDEDVIIVPLHPAETLEAVSAGRVNYMLSNPVLALIIQKRKNAKFLATMRTHAGSHFSGVIISKKGSGITTSGDLPGKFVLSYKFRRSAAAYVFQVKHLMDIGINPHKEFDIFREVRSSQDVIVHAVDRGLVDAGFIKSGLLEEMDREGKIDITKFHIVDRVSDSFPHVHSTKLYPEWTLSEVKAPSETVTSKLRSALFNLPSNHKACRQAKIAGFVPPEDFSELESALQSLRLPPFDK